MFGVCQGGGVSFAVCDSVRHEVGRRWYGARQTVRGALMTGSVGSWAEVGQSLLVEIAALTRGGDALAGQRRLVGAIIAAA